MNKVFLYFLLLGISCGFANAQQTATPYSFDNISNNVFKPNHQNSASPKALGVEIWSDNFDSDANWTIDNDGQTGTEYGWSIDSSVDTWWLGGGINSSSGGGFAELNNGDPFANGSGMPGSQMLNVVYTMTSIALDIPNLAGNNSNTDQVTLQYQESGARFNDLQEVQISVDGTNWSTIRNNCDHYPILSTMGGNPYPNPSYVSINLAPYITSNAAQVQIRFLWTTNFPYLSSNASVWSAYGWYIDDVKIFTNPDNDIQATESFWGTAGLNYSQIPKSQVAPIYFHSNAFNNGLNTQNNVELNVNINTVAWSGVSQSATVSVGAYDSLVVSTQYTPAAVPGVHSFTWDVTQNQVDDVPLNNILQSDSFTITDDIYAHDDNGIDGYRNNAGKAYEVGNFYDIWSNQMAYYIDVRLHDSTKLGSTVYGKIYSWYSSGASEEFADHLILEQQTVYHTVNASDLNGILSLPLIFPHNLTANKNRYFVVLATNGDDGASKDVVCATSGTSPEGFSYFYNDENDQWYIQPTTPVVRLNFNWTAWGLDEEEEALSTLNIFPNPASDQLTASYTLSSGSDVEIQIISLTGKVIKTISEVASGTGVQNITITTSDIATGAYYITVTTSDTVLKRKFVKK